MTVQRSAHSDYELLVTPPTPAPQLEARGAEELPKPHTRELNYCNIRGPSQRPAMAVRLPQKAASPDSEDLGNPVGVGLALE